MSFCLMLYSFCRILVMQNQFFITKNDTKLNWYSYHLTWLIQAFYMLMENKKNLQHPKQWYWILSEYLPECILDSYVVQIFAKNQCFNVKTTEAGFRAQNKCVLRHLQQGILSYTLSSRVRRGSPGRCFQGSKQVPPSCKWWSFICAE